MLGGQEREGRAAEVAQLREANGGLGSTKAQPTVQALRAEAEATAQALQVPPRETTAWLHVYFYQQYVLLCVFLYDVWI